MNKPLITIIVAIYKVEQYLPKCIESILNQTYSNFELILVNDGSPDDSITICHKYAKQDPRIVVLSKENGGQSTARNAAIEVAKGEYIGFIDGDDWIEPEMYEQLHNTLVSENADIVQCGCNIYTDDKVRKDVDYRIYQVYTSDEALLDLIHPGYTNINTSVCNKLFKRSTIKDIRFTPVRAFEDDEFVYKSIGASTKIVCINKWLYNYNIHDGSTMTSSFNLNKLALVTIQRNICEYLRVRLPQKYNESERSLCSKQFYILHELLLHPEIDTDGKYSSELIASIKDSYGRYIKNPLIGKNKYFLYAMQFLPKFVWKKILLKAF